ncbi:hypothetical protein OAM56_07015 [Alphaproteobacteria bacterium]|nr:hypothetical protein [Alphaproteobacteria bacterium]
MAITPRSMMGLPNSPSFRYKALNPAYQSDPRRILGQQLMQQGSSSAPVQTPLQGLGRLSSALVGAYLQKGAVDRQVAREGEYKDQLSNALSGMNLPANSPINALGLINPELAINAAVSRQTALDARKPTETFRTLTNEEAVAQNLPVDRGQVYQIGSVGKQIKPIGSTNTGSLGSKYNQLQRAIELKNRDNLTGPEEQELRGLRKILATETRINIANKETGNIESKVIPGLDLESVFTGKEKTEKDDDPLITKFAKLNKIESSYVSDLASATNDIKTVIDLAFNGDLQNGEYNKLISVGAGSNLGRAASGDSQKLFRALDNLSDLRLRKRTGATANPFEVTQYRDAVIPGITTREETFRSNLERLITELSSQVDSFKSGRNIKGLPKINLNDYLKKTEQTDDEVVY